MFKYFPHTNQEIEKMLDTIGVSNIEDLFSDIPKGKIYKKEIGIPLSQSEIELRKDIELKTKKQKEYISFRGGGAYQVYTPSIINYLSSRQEFLTSYTPYQAELSQGTLQYIFEYQTFIAKLTNMDAANASLYDGASASSEAINMCTSHNRKTKVIIASSVNPNYLEVCKTYCKYKNIDLQVVDYKNIKDNITEDTSCVLIQNPTYYGQILNYQDISDAIHEKNGLLIVNQDPSTLPILKTPGEYNADVVCGEAQTLGIGLSFGGPYLGYLSCKKNLIRKMPGRIVGKTVDSEGNPGYVLTIQAREQHIRRQKATSNICSNQSLIALQAAIYVSVMGKQGMKDVAKRSYNNAHYLREELLKTKKFEKVNNDEFFKEFILKANFDLEGFNKKLEKEGILGGIIIDKNKYLLATTELRTLKELDLFVRKVIEYV